MKKKYRIGPADGLWFFQKYILKTICHTNCSVSQQTELSCLCQNLYSYSWICLSQALSKKHQQFIITTLQSWYFTLDSHWKDLGRSQYYQVFLMELLPLGHFYLLPLYRLHTFMDFKRIHSNVLCDETTFYSKGVCVFICNFVKHCIHKYDYIYCVSYSNTNIYNIISLSPYKHQQNHWQAVQTLWDSCFC